MGKRTDLTGRVFGKLTVIGFSHVAKHSANHWKCRCSCGSIKSIYIGNLNAGKIKDCGCKPFRVDLTGKVFGRLKVVEFIHIKNHKAFWKCECSCGVIKSVASASLVSGGTKSCGCLAIKDLTGKQFGRWKVVKFSHTNTHRAACWECKCSCGNSKVVNSGCLIEGTSKSCGCLKIDKAKEQNKTHDLSGSPEYRIWAGIKGRCNNPNNYSAKDYGLRGIELCDKWNDFTNFYQDMGKRPSKSHTIERVDNDGNYELSNCVWATRLEQANNRRNNVFLTHNNKKQTISQWGRELGLPRQTISYRLKRGWSVKAVLTNRHKEATQ